MPPNNDAGTNEYNNFAQYTNQITKIFPVKIMPDSCFMFLEKLFGSYVHTYGIKSSEI